MPEKNDPWRNFRFLVEWDGVVQVQFIKVTIPDISADPIEYRDGNEIPTVRKLRGLIKYSNIICKRGVTYNLELFNWHKEIVAGKINSNRKNVSILLLDEEGNEAARWDFSNVWPTKYDAPDLNAIGNEIAVETLELAHEGIIKSK